MQSGIAQHALASMLSAPRKLANFASQHEMLSSARFAWHAQHAPLTELNGQRLLTHLQCIELHQFTYHLSCSQL